jgi:hypothetical protein
MPQTGQSGSIKAPNSRSALDALIAQRNELQGQLRSAEDRRMRLSEQRAGLQGLPGGQAAEVDRRIKTLDGTIDQLERQIAQANEFIAAGHARFGGQSDQPSPSADVAPGVPAIPPVPPIPEIPPFPGFPGVEVRESPPGIPVRMLLFEGVGFLLLGALAWVWAVRRLERRLGQRSVADPGQMTQLQQSVDAIAVEVERISENQRWVTKQINERALGGGEAQPVKVGSPEAARVPKER